MNPIRRTLLAAAAVLLAAPLLHAQVSESAISNQFDKLRSLSVDQRSADTIKLAESIRALPAGPHKVRFADDLAHLVTQGDQGIEALQAVADTLSQALSQSPVKAKKDQPPMQYLDLARLVRYENVTATLNDPLFAKASQVLADNDAEIAKADFTLKDQHGKKYTLSELRGKIVLINFWATSCMSCRQEMPNLDIIYTHYQSQGLVILSITSDNVFKVNNFISSMDYHPPVLNDFGGKVAKQFHIATGYHPPPVQNIATGKGGKPVQIDEDESADGVPKTFVFNREGKLVAQAIDQCTQRQFFALLAKTDLQP